MLDARAEYYLGKINQHELTRATIGFMFITTIKHIKSLVQIELYSYST